MPSLHRVRVDGRLDLASPVVSAVALTGTGVVSAVTDQPANLQLEARSGSFVFEGALGEADGAALLVDRLASAAAWDQGWNFKGMSQFNRSVSWMDSYAIALGYARAKEAVPVLCALAAKLTEKDHYSHFRAVAKALELIGDPRGADALARCLAAPGIGGHARTVSTLAPLPQFENATADRERTLLLREICLARALYRLGDTADGLGRKTLEAYARDPRGAYAAHARLVLEGK